MNLFTHAFGHRAALLAIDSFTLRRGTFLHSCFGTLEHCLSLTMRQFLEGTFSQTSSLVDPETVVKVEHLLLLFQGIISCRDISGSCNSGSGQLSDSNTEQRNHPDLSSLVEVNQA